MPIVNSIYKGKKLFTSEFFCPDCWTIQPYEIKPMSPELRVHRIPFMETQELCHVVACRICKTAYDPQVLDRGMQSLFRLAGSAKCQLEQGMSPGFLKLRLMSDGIRESFADQVLYLAQH